MTGSPAIGEQLIHSGFQQGVLVAAAGYVELTMPPGGDWSLQFVPPSEPCEQWVVVSQDCDILARSEPHVEMMACYWSPRGSAPYTGARMGNSYRYFWVKEHEHDGERGALIVDATRRVQVPKEALLALEPLDMEVDDPAFDRDFGRWLGSRYSRPALPPAVVEAIQRPIVNGIRNFGRNDAQATAAQELVRELRLYPLDESPPYDVVMIMLIRDDADPDDERLAAFRGWIETWLRESPGTVRSVDISTLRPSEMYVSEYEDTLKISLDQYSAGVGISDASGPVRGIDHE